MPYTWSVSGPALPDGLSIDASSGAITGTPTLNGAFNFTVQVADSQGTPATDTQALSITVSAAPLDITTTTLADGTVGAAYSQTVAATGGVIPYAWSVTGGALPDGLALNASTGEVSGTPTAYGAFNFTVAVADSQSTPATDTQALSITIAPATLEITTTTLPDGTMGSPYSQAVLVTGGATPYTWSVAGGALPGGLSLSGSTGLIAGTPVVTGTFNLTVQVRDSQGTPATDTQALSIVVGAGVDTDGDGLPDPWEILHFGDLDEGAYGDGDDDGWYNITEFLRGQNPTREGHLYSGPRDDQGPPAPVDEA